MAKTNYNYTVKFNIDPARGEGHQESIQVGGRPYKVLVVPDDGHINFSEGIQKRAEQITLGPRGVGCPCCGK